MLLRLIKRVLGARRGRPTEAAIAEIRGALQAGNPGHARRIAEDALARSPDHVDLLQLLAVAALQQGDRPAAIAALERAAASPSDPQPALGLGYLLLEAGRLDEAIARFERAVQIDPRLYEARLSLGKAWEQKGELATAERELGAAIALRPAAVEPRDLLTLVLYAQGRHEEADAACAETQRLRPADGREIFRALLVPAIAESVEAIDASRARVAERVARLTDGPQLSVQNPVAEIGITPFYLAYHGRNDRDLQRSIARLIRKAYRPTRSRPLDRRPRTDRIRIGLVSEHFNSHSVGRMYLGFVSALNRDAFEVTVFSLRDHDDAVAQRYRAQSDHYVSLGGRSLPEIEQAIAERAMDVLYFVDVGMDPLTYFLAYSRLAPLQLAGRGHPDTTGIDTLDAFVSGDALETPGADEHYSERLIRLACSVMPGYERPIRPDPLKPRSALGLDEGAHLYACPQAPFKIHPDFDQAIAGILRGDPRGELILVEGRQRALTVMLKQRFARTVPDVAARVRVLPHMPYSDYLNLIACADVMLDPFHFGGDNTTYESLAQAVPVVTLPPQFLRGRLAQGCYAKMGMHECVADSVQHYVDLALRLGTDRDYRDGISARIAERCELLFGDREMVRALEGFLEEHFASAR